MESGDTVFVFLWKEVSNRCLYSNQDRRLRNSIENLDRSYSQLMTHVRIDEDDIYSICFFAQAV